MIMSVNFLFIYSFIYLFIYRAVLKTTFVRMHPVLRLLLTIGSCFSVHYRVMEDAGSLESTKEA